MLKKLPIGHSHQGQDIPCQIPVGIGMSFYSHEGDIVTRNFRVSGCKIGSAEYIAELLAAGIKVNVTIK